MNDLDEATVQSMAFAEGFEDGQKGDNYNPFDDLVQLDQWEAYERGFIQGVMSGSYDDGQPSETQEWHDYDADC